MSGLPAGGAARSTETVRTLLQAEAEAAERIQQARRAREERVRKAAAEAEQEIAAYRVRKEEEYQRALRESSGASESVAAELQRRADEQISRERELLQQRREQAVRALEACVWECDERALR